jgi:hypothetical protein
MSELNKKMEEKKENLLRTKEIFDKMFQAALEGSEYTFTEENIAIEYHVFVSIFKKSGIEPSLVNFHSLNYLFFEDNKVNFRCANKKDFYISPWNMWEDQNDFYENYLDELTITFDNLFK